MPWHAMACARPCHGISKGMSLHMTWHAPWHIRSMRLLTSWIDVKSLSSVNGTVQVCNIRERGCHTCSSVVVVVERQQAYDNGQKAHMRQENVHRLNNRAVPSMSTMGALGASLSFCYSGWPMPALDAKRDAKAYGMAYLMAYLRACHGIYHGMP